MGEGVFYRWLPRVCTLPECLMSRNACVWPGLASRECVFLYEGQRLRLRKGLVEFTSVLFSAVSGASCAYVRSRVPC